MNNPAKPIYISYKGNTVQINTNVREGGLWVQVYFTSGDLMQAATVDATRRLLGLPDDFGPLSLYSVDYTTTPITKTPLGTDMLLSTINAGTTSATALIIESINDTITLNQYMISTLPTAEYHTTLPSASSTEVTNPRHAGHVFTWVDFERNVLQWITDNSARNNEQRLARPTFVPLLIREEVPQLQPFVQLNLLNIATPCCLDCDFVSWGIVDIEDPNVRGKPDFAMRKNGVLAAPIEVKGKWTLPDADIVDNSDGHVQSVIVQIYTYMRHNHRQFGIITSYDFTWFCYRQSCDNCSESHEILYISPGVSAICNDNSRPHILQCFAYFGSIVTGSHVESPPSSARSSPRTSVVDDNLKGGTNSPRILGFSRNLSKSQPISSNDLFESTIEQNFEVDDFNLKSILGYGRAKVCYEETLGIALKFADVWKSPDMLSELKNEVRTYTVLSALQGDCIPHLKLYGNWDGLYCIGFSVHGSSPSTLNPAQKQQLLDSIDKIHALGVLHGDIKRENILMDEKGKLYFIDFGFAKMNPSRAVQEDERKRLLHCLEVL